jgi:putative acetyltransferase
MLEIIQAETEAQIEASRELFRDYEAWFGLSLCFQNFEDEVRNLPGKYVQPRGRLLLAYSGDELAGCIAMRDLGDGICEMKRLFVRGGFRGKSIGQQLIEKILDEAAKEDYKKMRLDTFPPKMGKAVELYRSYGFYEIPPYYENPYEDVLFMEKNLTNSPAAL